jgi:hypothetical protein
MMGSNSSVVAGVVAGMEQEMVLPGQVREIMGNNSKARQQWRISKIA